MKNITSMLGGDLGTLFIITTISIHSREEHESVCCAKIIVGWIEIDFCRKLVRKLGEID